MSVQRQSDYLDGKGNPVARHEYDTAARFHTLDCILCDAFSVSARMLEVARSEMDEHLQEEHDIPMIATSLY